MRAPTEQGRRRSASEGLNFPHRNLITKEEEQHLRHSSFAEEAEDESDDGVRRETHTYRSHQHARRGIATPTRRSSSNNLDATFNTKKSSVAGAPSINVEESLQRQIAQMRDQLARTASANRRLETSVEEGERRWGLSGKAETKGDGADEQPVGDGEEEPYGITQSTVRSNNQTSRSSGAAAAGASSAMAGHGRHSNGTEVGGVVRVASSSSSTGALPTGQPYSAALPSAASVVGGSPSRNLRALAEAVADGSLDPLAYLRTISGGAGSVVGGAERGGDAPPPTASAAAAAAALSRRRSSLRGAEGSAAAAIARLSNTSHVPSPSVIDEASGSSDDEEAFLLSLIRSHRSVSGEVGSGGTPAATALVAAASGKRASGPRKLSLGPAQPQPQPQRRSSSLEGGTSSVADSIASALRLVAESKAREAVVLRQKKGSVVGPRPSSSNPHNAAFVADTVNQSYRNAANDTSSTIASPHTSSVLPSLGATYADTAHSSRMPSVSAAAAADPRTATTNNSTAVSVAGRGQAWAIASAASAGASVSVGGVGLMGTPEAARQPPSMVTPPKQGFSNTYEGLQSTTPRGIGSPSQPLVRSSTAPAVGHSGGAVRRAESLPLRNASASLRSSPQQKHQMAPQHAHAHRSLSAASHVSHPDGIGLSSAATSRAPSQQQQQQQRNTLSPLRAGGGGNNSNGGGYLPPTAFLPDPFVREYGHVIAIIDKYASLYHRQRAGQGALAPGSSPPSGDQSQGIGGPHHSQGSPPTRGVYVNDSSGGNTSPPLFGQTAEQRQALRHAIAAESASAQAALMARRCEGLEEALRAKERSEADLSRRLESAERHLRRLSDGEEAKADEIDRMIAAEEARQRAAEAAFREAIAARDFRIAALEEEVRHLTEVVANGMRGGAATASRAIGALPLAQSSTVVVGPPRHSSSFGDAPATKRGARFAGDSTYGAGPSGSGSADDLPTLADGMETCNSDTEAADVDGDGGYDSPPPDSDDDAPPRRSPSHSQRPQPPYADPHSSSSLPRSILRRPSAAPEHGPLAAPAADGGDNSIASLVQREVAKALHNQQQRGEGGHFSTPHRRAQSPMGNGHHHNSGSNSVGKSVTIVPPQPANHHHVIANNVHTASEAAEAKAAIAAAYGVAQPPPAGPQHTPALEGGAASSAAGGGGGGGEWGAAGIVDLLSATPTAGRSGAAAAREEGIVGAIAAGSVPVGGGHNGNGHQQGDSALLSIANGAPLIDIHRLTPHRTPMTNSPRQHHHRNNNVNVNGAAAVGMGFGLAPSDAAAIAAGDSPYSRIFSANTPLLAGRPTEATTTNPSILMPSQFIRMHRPPTADGSAAAREGADDEAELSRPMDRMMDPMSSPRLAAGGVPPAPQHPMTATGGYSKAVGDLAAAAAADAESNGGSKAAQSARGGGGGGGGEGSPFSQSFYAAVSQRQREEQQRLNKSVPKYSSSAGSTAASPRSVGVGVGARGSLPSEAYNRELEENRSLLQQLQRERRRHELDVAESLSRSNNNVLLMGAGGGGATPRTRSPLAAAAFAVPFAAVPHSHTTVPSPYQQQQQQYGTPRVGSPSGGGYAGARGAASPILTAAADTHTTALGPFSHPMAVGAVTTPLRSGSVGGGGGGSGARRAPLPGFASPLSSVRQQLQQHGVAALSYSNPRPYLPTTAAANTAATSTTALSPSFAGGVGSAVPPRLVPDYSDHHAALRGASGLTAVARSIAASPRV